MTTTLDRHPTPVTAPVPPAPPARGRRRRPTAALPLALLGFTLVIGARYLTVDVLALPRFRAIPGPTEVLREWFAPDWSGPVRADGR